MRDQPGDQPVEHREEHHTERVNRTILQIFLKLIAIATLITITLIRVMQRAQARMPGNHRLDAR